MITINGIKIRNENQCLKLDCSINNMNTTFNGGLLESEASLISLNNLDI
jgi:hypothetical protein